MHLNLHRAIAPIALLLLAASAPPALAQYLGPSRAAQKTAPRGAARQPAPAATNKQNPKRYDVRQTGGTEPGSAQQADPRMPQPAPRAVIAGIAPPAPFTLTPHEQQLLDQILIQWERQSDRVKTFKCGFDRWEINETFVPKEFGHLLTEGRGYIKFKAPDHGIYRVTEQREWNAQKQVLEPRTTGLDHWVCNGKSIFEFNAQKRQLIERPLAPEMQGKAITEGPLPFIFGAKADQLKRRYWMRDITQPADVNKKIWLEAWPKFQQDAANFQHAIVILDQSTFMPDALRVILPDGKNKQDYQFTDTQVNDPLSIFKGDFLPPITPFGWTKVVERPPPPSQQIAPPAAPAQAQRAPLDGRK